MQVISFIKDDLSPLVSLALLVFGWFQWRIGQREKAASKQAEAQTKQAEAAAQYAVSAQTQAEKERDIVTGREEDLWEKNKAFRDDLLKEVARLRVDLASVREECRQIGAERDSMNLAVKALADEVETLKARLAQANQVIEERGKLARENTSLKKRVAELETQVKGLQQELEALRSEVRPHSQSVTG
jgi:chromosome segregation ATPase